MAKNVELSAGGVLMDDDGRRLTVAALAPTGGSTGQVPTVQADGTIALATPSATSGTDLGWFSITDYGAVGDGVTDCTAALQSAINAAIAAGGGTVFVPPGIFQLDGPQVTGTVAGPGYTYSGQLILPARPLTSAPIGICIRGATPARYVLWGSIAGDAVPVEASGLSILRSSATSGNVFDGIPNNTGTITYFTNFDLSWEDLVIRVPNNPQCGGLNGRWVRGMNVDRCSIEVNASSMGLIAPTGSGYGVRLPGVTNGTNCAVRESCVSGFPTGIQHSEHAAIRDTAGAECIVGIEPSGGAHLAVYDRLLLIWNQHHIKPTGAQTIFGSIAMESESGTVTYKTDVFDPTNLLSGKLSYLRRARANARPALGQAFNLGMARLDTDGRTAAQATATTTAFVSDDSTQALPQLVSGQFWSTGATPTFGITGNKAKALVDGTLAAVVVPHNLTTTQTVLSSITLSATPNRVDIGVGVATVDVGNGIFVMFEDDSYTSDTLLILKKVAGAQTILASGAVTLTAGGTYALQVERTATTITGKVDGVTVATYTLSAPEQALYNTRYNAAMFTITGASLDDRGSAWNTFDLI